MTVTGLIFPATKSVPLDASLFNNLDILTTYLGFG